MSNADGDSAPITADDLRKLRDENDRLEQTIVQHTKKFDIVEDDLPVNDEKPPPKPLGGVRVMKFNVLPQFAEEAMFDRGTPYTPIQCHKRGHDGTMFTS